MVKRTEYYKESVFVQGFQPSNDDKKALRKLNSLMLNPPSVFDYEELDAYYDEVIELEKFLGKNIEIRK